MPLLLVIGGVLILAGLALLATWISSFLIVLKAFLPLGVIGLGGLLAYFGWEERQDRKGATMDFSSPAEANRYQADALAYQETIDRLGEPEAASALEPEAPRVVIEKAPHGQQAATVTVAETEIKPE
jgi:hypothetical protein